MNNAIYLRRRRKVLIEPGNNTLQDDVTAALLKNIEPLGFTLSPALIQQIKTLTIDDLTTFYGELIGALRALVGAHREWKPMYPNFPVQVMEMSEAHLYLNAIIHYVTNALPQYIKKERLPLLDQTELKIIEAGTNDDFISIFTTLVSGRSSLSAQDKEDVSWFIKHFGNEIFALFPETLPSRETVAYVGAELIGHTTRSEEFLDKHVNTATDVLRLAVAISQGDVSLAASTKFKTFTRSQRRLMLRLLDRSSHAAEDMLRWKGCWLRLGERLHPGEWQRKFPNAYRAFDALRNNRPVETYNSRIEAALENRDLTTLLNQLQSRPGEFARRLDHLLRLQSETADTTLNTFKEVVADVSTPVLLQVWTHFKNRDSNSDLRIFFPKGNVGKVQALPSKVPTLSVKICNSVVELIEGALRQRFGAMPALGNCYLDEQLRNYTAPFSQRSASKSLRTLSRGSRLPLPESNVVRLFLWWKNGSCRTDIDLSAAIYDANFSYLDVLAYYNLKGYGGHHSGDIVDAPTGAAEFIDLDVEKLITAGARYIVMSLHSFTMQPFCDLPECFAGWMSRNHAASGEIFEPKTVQDRIDLAADTQISIPLIIDLQKRMVLWTDIALKDTPWWNNVETNLSGVSLMLRAMTGLSKTNLYDLFDLHIQARGERVLDIEKAETIFSKDKGITPFDLDKIAADFM